jgi:hypothetical protein
MIISVRMKDKTILTYEVCDICDKPVGKKVKKSDIKYTIIKKSSIGGLKICDDCKHDIKERQEKKLNGK